MSRIVKLAKKDRNKKRLGSFISLIPLEELFIINKNKIKLLLNFTDNADLDRCYNWYKHISCKPRKKSKMENGNEHKIEFNGHYLTLTNNFQNSTHRIRIEETSIKNDKRAYKRIAYEITFSESDLKDRCFINNTITLNFQNGRIVEFVLNDSPSSPCRQLKSK